MTDTPDDRERCGWNVRRPRTISGQPADFVRVSNGTVWFLMPITVYDEFEGDDEAFASLCQRNAQQIMARAMTGEPGVHVPGAIKKEA